MAEGKEPHLIRLVLELGQRVQGEVLLRTFVIGVETRSGSRVVVLAVQDLLLLYRRQ